MKHRFTLRLSVLVALALGGIACLRADDALFIGNSYTFGGPEQAVNAHGGVPKLVEAIAVSKGKKLSTLMLAVPGKNLAYHLSQPQTDEDLKAKPWDWVVLQGFSTEATHMGSPDDFLKNGVEFYKRIMAADPKARVVLYETWSRPKGSPYYTGESTPKSFADQKEMDSEIQKNYTELYRRMEAIDPGHQIALAPVGLAFQMSREKYPDINLNFTDLHHANTAGSYLAALVIYATIYQDTPKGATREFFGTSLDEALASKLQEIAGEAIAAQAK
ncbi:MAG TPA: DUF4886 domain-containing protein [Chthoniobacteraceae bacterium]|nr:DUF4886 domain-containing protein [Chthoniobacteraceae bacterium]